MVRENTHDASLDMVDLEGCISSGSQVYIPSPGGVGHLQEEVREEGEGKFALMVEVGIDCRSEVFEDGPLVLSDLREIL